MISDSEEMATSAKGKLQELLQKRGYPLPSYKLTNRDGPSHQPTFTVTLTVKNKANRTLYTKEASASQLKEAEKMCAVLALPEVEVLLDDVQSDDEFEMVRLFKNRPFIFTNDCKLWSSHHVHQGTPLSHPPPAGTLMEIS